MNETTQQDLSSVDALPGIGPVTRRWLEAIGITHVQDLRGLGALEAYRRLKFMFPREANLNALYALEAALRGCHWQHLPSDVKAVLQDEARAIDVSFRRSAAFRCL
jgi:DNA transformation protein